MSKRAAVTTSSSSKSSSSKASKKSTTNSNGNKSSKTKDSSPIVIDPSGGTDKKSPKQKMVTEKQQNADIDDVLKSFELVACHNPSSWHSLMKWISNKGGFDKLNRLSSFQLINGIADVVLREILSYLRLSDMMVNCSNVSKRFQRIIPTVPLHLSFIDTDKTIVKSTFSHIPLQMIHSLHIHSPLISWISDDDDDVLSSCTRLSLYSKNDLNFKWITNRFTELPSMPLLQQIDIYTGHSYTHTDGDGKMIGGWHLAKGVQCPNDLESLLLKRESADVKGSEKGVKWCGRSVVECSKCKRRCYSALNCFPLNGCQLNTNNTDAEDHHLLLPLCNDCLPPSEVAECTNCHRRYHHDCSSDEIQEGLSRVSLP
jgi:hypothetical protein